MKKIFKLNVFIFMLSLSFFLPELSADLPLPFTSQEPNISMDFQDANLKDILKVFSMQSGLNFIASEAVQERKITLYLDKVPLSQTMDNLFKANNLSYELDKEANIFTVKDWGKPQIETVTKVFNLKYATVSSSPLKAEISNYIGGQGEGSSTGGGTQAGGDSGITHAVKKILSEFGSVIEDSRTNSLIVIDIPSRMSMIAQTIAALDVPVPQVMLEVEMLDVSKNTVDKLGFKFGQTPITLNFLIQGASVPSKFPWGSLFGDTGKGITNGSFGVNTNTTSSAVSTYQVLLDFLKTQSDTKYLARPRILTLNNETAEIKIATQEAVGSITNTQGQGTASSTTTSAERIETGVTLRVTPQINPETGEITMFVVPTVKDTSTSTLSSSYKDPEERSTKSMVRIKDGETVIIGGLIRNDTSQTITKLPILGDIPVLGALFRHKNKDRDRERELLVFITPHIITDASIKLAQAKKTTLPQREQNTLSAIDRQGIIDTSLNSFEKKKK
ncbi:MAG: secretin N-terminal domain-containing protein [Candidatus Omnitrophota bacterium]|nr:secretin N-terminal domain-containing protein [Candidatus Omnitrophota bacterium]